MKSKALETLIHEFGSVEMTIEEALRKAYALGRRERGKQLAVGWVYDSDLTAVDNHGLLRVWKTPGSCQYKVEVIRVAK